MGKQGEESAPSTLNSHSKLNITQSSNEHNTKLDLPENLQGITGLSIFFMFVALSAAIILCFILQAVRFKSRKASRIRRYGVVAGRGDVEMMPLDNEDDDEDATVFDITDLSLTKP